MTRVPVIDGFGRKASYLRLSVTDRCNLRCRYCMPDGVRFIPHDRVLRYEEMYRLIETVAELGIDKIRLTGGEPFVRKGVVEFMAGIRERFPQLDLRVTTNATLLSRHLHDLASIGVTRLNISLDSLQRDVFERLTGVDALHDVLGAIRKAVDLGFHIKINAVALKGINDRELTDFVQLAATHPVDVRFIEFMPIGSETRWLPTTVWTAAEILDEVRQNRTLVPVPASKNSGPARMYEMEGGQGRIGVISPLSSHFCAGCNRLRITPTGGLRTCLFSDKEYRLRPVLRHPRLGKEALKRIILGAGKAKPLGNRILEQRTREAVCSKRMSAIGG